MPYKRLLILYRLSTLVVTNQDAGRAGCANWLKQGFTRFTFHSERNQVDVVSTQNLLTRFPRFGSTVGFVAEQSFVSHYGRLIVTRERA